MTISTKFMGIPCRQRENSAGDSAGAHAIFGE
jgi:hypothetical protein